MGVKPASEFASPLILRYVYLVAGLVIAEYVSSASSDCAFLSYIESQILPHLREALRHPVEGVDHTVWLSSEFSCDLVLHGFRLGFILEGVCGHRVQIKDLSLHRIMLSCFVSRKTSAYS
ncbi:hypothetical protein F2Q70_00016846 [Brassica cretica]|nr:hypothetical protein F2Q70_00016846 [Brassica cretica]